MIAVDPIYNARQTTPLVVTSFASFLGEKQVGFFATIRALVCILQNGGEFQILV